MLAGTQHQEKGAVAVAMGVAIPANESHESQRGLRLHGSFIRHTCDCGAVGLVILSWCMSIGHGVGGMDVGV